MGAVTPPDPVSDELLAAEHPVRAIVARTSAAGIVMMRLMVFTVLRRSHKRYPTFVTIRSSPQAPAGVRATAVASKYTLTKETDRGIHR
jgi:hypothetical protein